MPTVEATSEMPIGGIAEGILGYGGLYAILAGVAVDHIALAPIGTPGEPPAALHTTGKKHHDAAMGTRPQAGVLA
jgi:hypothetical protein